MTKMCLDIKTNDIQTNDIIWGVLENGFDCEQMWVDCGTNDYNELEAEKIKNFISKKKADVVITMNFCPTISKACFEMGIPYASWLYDSPVQAIYHGEAYRDTNYFFVFDRHLLEVTKKRNLKNAFYLPLAANVTRTGQIELTGVDEEEFSCEVSFVGVQYKDGRGAYYRGKLDELRKKEFDSILQNLFGKWDGTDRVHNSMSEDLLNAMVEAMRDKEEFAKTGLPARVYFEEGIIPRVIAYEERRKMMESVAEFSTRWYGSGADSEDKIPGVKYLPRLTYEERLFKAYNLSKINLSTALHGITSGVPLRVFDIMGIGGFCLTNYQAEIDELFDVGKEIVVYHNFEEMKELAKYYLTHESERIRILAAGYNRVCRDYTYPVAIKKIMDKVF